MFGYTLVKKKDIEKSDRWYESLLLSHHKLEDERDDFKHQRDNILASHDKLTEENLALSQRNQGLTGDLNAVVDGNQKLANKNDVMLAALKAVKPSLDAYGPHHKIVETVIAEGEKTL